MKLNKQAQLISIALFHDLVDHSKVVAWVDDIIDKSKNAEDWMIRISLSSPSEFEECSYILSRQFGWDNLVSFSEFASLMLGLYKETNKPLYECNFLLALADFKRENERGNIIKFRQLILEMDRFLDANEFSDESIKKVEFQLERIYFELETENKEIISFIKNFA